MITILVIRSVYEARNYTPFAQEKVLIKICRQRISEKDPPDETRNKRKKLTPDPTDTQIEKWKVHEYQNTVKNPSFSKCKHKKRTRKHEEHRYTLIDELKFPLFPTISIHS